MMSVDHAHIAYQLDGREWRPLVERGVRRDAFVFEFRRPEWTDGTPMTAADLEVARGVIERIYRHWGYTVEFVQPEEPASEVTHPKR